MTHIDWMLLLVAQALGHSWHCANRISFGDGACECRRTPLMPSGKVHPR